MTKSILPQAPVAPWDEQGVPQFGLYCGECTRWNDPWNRRLRRIKQEKAWQWFGVFSPDLMVGGAVVRTGYAGNVFLWVFDRLHRELLVDHSRVTPTLAAQVPDIPTHATSAAYSAVVEQLRIARTQNQWHVTGSIGDTRLDLVLDSVMTPITAICPVAEGEPADANVTRKEAGLSVDGRVRIGLDTWDLNGAFGFLDHSHGMMARETSWKWAAATGLDSEGALVGLNLVQGFNEELENVVWLPDGPRSLGKAHFEHDEQAPAEAWRVTADDTELELIPQGLRSQNLDLGLVSSRYAQPLGTWRGTLAGARVELTGVAEDHFSRW